MTPEAIAALSPFGARVGMLAISAAHEQSLHPEEAALVQRAVETRRAEFATGRALLRSLLGDEGRPVLALTSRAPAVPDGVRASLAHDDALAVAVVLPAGVASEIAGIGIDVERFGAVRGDDAHAVVRPDEGPLDPTMVFVIKEAAYKAWSTAGGRLLDHHEVRVAVSQGTAAASFSLTSFSAASFSLTSFSATVTGSLTMLRGNVAQVDGRWLAVAVLDAPR